ncbi:MAG: FkbM family methyltransferase [Opitutaceae bacterium]
MHPALAFTRNQRLPLNLRRLVGGWFVPMSGRTFTLDLEPVFHGRLDNYIEWVVYVTGQFFEFPYINLVRRLHKGGVALDIGANLGNHALAFSAIFDEIHAVEPYPPVYERLAARREITDRIHPYRVALSDRSGSLSFQEPRTDNLGIGRIAEGGGMRVEALRGDDFVRAEIHSRIDFVKVDVEGHELEVIRGLAGTLESNRPTVIFEASKAVMKTSDSIRACFDLFPQNYVFHSLSGQSSWPLQRATARMYPMCRDAPRSGRRSVDLIARPREKVTGDQR